MFFAGSKRHLVYVQSAVLDRLRMLILGPFVPHATSSVVLVLATVGIYGLISYRVNHGARELGLRMALGAPARSILTLVLRHGLTLAAAGVAAGLVAALVLTGYMRSMLYGVGATDAWTYATVASALLLTALFACYIPARRVTRVNPMEVVSCE